MYNRIGGIERLTMILQIELTNICNLDCVYCPRPFLSRNKSHMSLNIFERILNNFIGEATTVILSKDGEPFLHPQFEVIVKKLNSVYKGKIDIYTNGSFLSEGIVDFLGSLDNDIHIFVTEHPIGRNRSQIDHCYKTRNNTIKAIAKHYNNLTFYLTLHSITKNRELDEKIWQDYWEMEKQHHSNIKAIHLNKNINPWLGFIKEGKTTIFSKCPFIEYPFLCFGVTGNALACCIDLNEELIIGNISNDTKTTILENLSTIRRNLHNNTVKDMAPCNRCIKLEEKVYA